MHGFDPWGRDELKCDFLSVVNERGEYKTDMCISDITAIVKFWEVSDSAATAAQQLESLPSDFGELLLPVSEFQLKVEHPPAWNCESSDTMWEVARSMGATGRKHVCVCDPLGHLVATFSQVDMARIVLDGSDEAWRREFKRKRRAAKERGE